MSHTTFDNIDISDAELVAKLEVADLDNNDLMTIFFATNIDENRIQNKKNEKTKQTNVFKWANISNKIFDYFHFAICKNLFFFAWYDDLIYADDVIFDRFILQKLLPEVCYDRSNCNSF